MALVTAAFAQLALGVLLFLLGRWGRNSADSLVPLHLDREERRRRADSLARAALVFQAIGLLLGVLALGAGIAGSIAPDFRLGSR